MRKIFVFFLNIKGDILGIRRNYGAGRVQFRLIQNEKKPFTFVKGL
ncbi:hypothetical protein ROSI111154_20360 [Rouxiella silvae]